MNSTTLECGHSWLWRTDAPTGLVLCRRCDDYKAPQAVAAYLAAKPVRRGRLSAEERAARVAEAKVLHESGVSPNDIAEVMGFGRSTIATWIEE